MNPALVCHILCYTTVVELLVTHGIGWYFLVTSPVDENGLVAVQPRAWIVSFGGMAVGLLFVGIVFTGNWVLYAEQLALPAVEVPSMPLPANTETPVPVEPTPTKNAPSVLVTPPRSKASPPVNRPLSTSRRKRDHGF